MDDSDPVIPLDTLETIARSFYKAAVGYGFHQVDYLRFVNLILDMSMKGAAPPPAEATPAPSASQGESGPFLPMEAAEIAIRDFDEARDRALFDGWTADETGRYFRASGHRGRITGLTSTCDRAFIRPIVCSRQCPGGGLGQPGLLDALRQHEDVAFPSTSATSA